MSLKRRRNVLKRAKGYRHERSKKERRAKESLVHAGKSAFANRRDKKNDFRSLWIVRMNAALRENGVKSYSTFIAKLKKEDIQLDRKVMAYLASERPAVFARFLKKVA